MSKIKLPLVSEYTESQLNMARSVSPAVDRYMNIIADAKAKNSTLTVEDRLRTLRHSYWIQSALGVICQSASPQQVVNFWSQSADLILKQAWQSSGASDLPLALLAFGKLGSYELNLSSDVDLMFVSLKPPDAELFTTIHKFINTLTEVTARGFCFRVDTDLRPGGRFSPLTSSIDQMEDHYWSQGMTWERMAIVRLRALAGPPDLVKDILDRCHKFTFRKYIDYTLSDDLSILRKEFVGPYLTPNDQGVQIKLCPGGIRDLELFVHSLQVIHGARSPELRVTQTAQAFEALKELKILPQTQIQDLSDSYWFLRDIENHMHVANDTQSYWLPKKSVPSLKQRPELKNELAQHLQKTDKIVSQFLGEIENIQETLPATMEAQKKWLESLGFNSNSVLNIWPDVIEMTAHSLKSHRDELIRRKFLFQFVNVLVEQALDKNLGMGLLKDFIYSTKAKASFFSLLTRKPEILIDLARLFGCSPYLGTIISSRPELIDGFITKQQEVYSDDWQILLEQLAESRLLNEVLAASQLLASKNTMLLFESLSQKADEVTGHILDNLKSQYKIDDLDILALGKWGGMELGLKSDLDFIFTTKMSATETHHKVIKRFISRLTEQHRGGQIYSIDLRLRPMGGAGALLVTESILEDYLLNKSQAWERQAYLKARPIHSTEFSPRSCMFQRNSLLNQDDLAELKSIRSQLLKSPLAGQYDLKMNPGGLIDMELCLQTLLLHNKIDPLGSSSLDFFKALESLSFSQDVLLLKKNYYFFRSLEQLYQMTSNQSSSIIRAKHESFDRLGQLLNSPTKQLEAKIQDALKNSESIIKKINPCLI